MDKIIRLCENGKFEEALQLIEQDISTGNVSSELFRIKGQGELELGRIDDAINSLIEALKIDKLNENALILIGNIYFKEKNDAETALKYFDKVLELNTDNYIGLANIGGVIAQAGDFNKAITYFKEALDIKSDYENALFGLALSSNYQKKYLEAFKYASLALKNTVKKNDIGSKKVYQNAHNLINVVCKEYAQSIEEDQIFSEYRLQLEKASGRKVNIVKDNSISTLAKIEIAEYHNKLEHNIKLNDAHQGYSYYVMHELTHLKLIIEAREKNENELFTTNELSRTAFDKKLNSNPKFKKLKSSIGDRTKGLADQLFNGLMLQMYNAPIDLFIDQYLYDSYETLRPLQYIAMNKIIGEAVKGATEKSIKESIPAFVRESNIALSVPMMKQFESLFGVNVLNSIKEKHLIKKGSQLYLQYLELKDDKAPAEEYDLIRWWAEDLNINTFFNLQVEKNSDPLQDQLSKIENDPLNLEGDSSYEDEELAKFIATHKSDGLKMHIVFYMIDCLSYIKGKGNSQEIGFEIAELGRTGIDPNKDDTYHLATVKEKKFTGWKLLAWMYTCWSDFKPEMVSSFQLDFDKEYEMAKNFKN